LIQQIVPISQTNKELISNQTRATKRNPTALTIPRNNLRPTPLHHIQTISIQTRKTKQLRHALHKHHDDGQRDAAEVLLHAPSIQQHTRRDHDPQERESGAQTIFRDTGSAQIGVFQRDVVAVAAAEEGSQDVAETGGEVE
jgi:hypothetical protein